MNKVEASINKKIIKKENALISIKRNFIKDRTLYLMFLLPLLFYLIFCYVPMYGVVIAFKDYNVFEGMIKSPWVGAKYFQKFLIEPYFWKTVKNTLLLNIYSLLWAFPAPIILALLLNEIKRNRFKRLVQTVSYLPHFISTVVVCGMVVNFLSYDGILNQSLKSIFDNWEPVHFLVRPEYFRTIYIGSGIWQGIGWGSIIYLAALSSIDTEQYEAAIIDGANRWKQMRYITVPGIMPTISIMFILAVGGIMGVAFEKVLLLSNGSIMETADVIQTYVYRRGLVGSDFSYATAVGLFQSVISFIFLGTANYVAQKLGDTSLW